MVSVRVILEVKEELEERWQDIDKGNNITENDEDDGSRLCWREASRPDNGQVTVYRDSQDRSEVTQREAYSSRSIDLQSSTWRNTDNITESL